MPSSPADCHHHEVGRRFQAFPASCGQAPAGYTCAMGEIAARPMVVCRRKRLYTLSHSTGITDVVIDGYLGESAGGASSGTPKLTGRERQIVQLVAEGKTVKEIARVLHISPKTADTNRRHVMNKLRHLQRG